MRYSNAVEHGSVALQQLVHAPILLGFKIHAEMPAKFAAVLHDRIADRLTFVVVRFQRHVNIVMGVEVFGQCPRIGCRFGHAETHMRPRIGGGIADHGHPAEQDRWRGEIVNRRNKGLLDLERRIEQRRWQNLTRLLVHLRNQISADQ